MHAAMDPGQAAGPVHLQVQCGALDVRGAWAGHHHQEVHAGLSAWSSLSRDMLQTLLRFSPRTWVPQPLSSLLPSPSLQQVCYASF